MVRTDVCKCNGGSFAIAPNGPVVTRYPNTDEDRIASVTEIALDRSGDHHVLVVEFEDGTSTDVPCLSVKIAVRATIEEE